MAKKRRKRRTMAGEAMGFVGAGIGMGIGAGVLEGVGGVPATYAQAAVGRMAGFMPAMGTVAGAGMTMRQLRKLGRRY